MNAQRTADRDHYLSFFLFESAARIILITMISWFCVRSFCIDLMFYEVVPEHRGARLCVYVMISIINSWR